MPKKEPEKGIFVNIKVINVVEVRYKGELMGFKVYISDTVHQTKFPRKPGDLKGREIPPSDEPLAKGYYGTGSVAAVQQALLDYEVWREQGYKRYEQN